MWAGHPRQRLNKLNSREIQRAECWCEGQNEENRKVRVCVWPPDRDSQTHDCTSVIIASDRESQPETVTAANLCFTNEFIQV